MLPSSDSKTPIAHPDLEDLLLLQTGELDSEQTDAVRNHLEACSHCRKRINTAENLYSRVARAGSRKNSIDGGDSKRNWRADVGGIAVLLICLGGVFATIRFIRPAPSDSPSAVRIPKLSASVGAKQTSVEAPLASRPVPEINPIPVADPLDKAEVHVRVTLHRLGLDATTLIAVERNRSGIRLWGIVPDDQTRLSLIATLGNRPNVEIAVRTEAEQQRDPQMLPWRSFQGDRPPLATEELRTLYPTNSPERQQWQNTLDRLTRELVGLARARQGLLQLSGKRGVGTTVIRSTVKEMEMAMAQRTESVAHALQPLLGEMNAEKIAAARALSPHAANHLYLLVHDLVFLSRSASSASLEETVSQIRSLLHLTSSR